MRICTFIFVFSIFILNLNMFLSLFLDKKDITCLMIAFWWNSELHEYLSFISSRFRIYIYIYIYLSIYLSVYLYIYTSIYLSIYIYIYIPLSIYLSIYLYIYMCVYSGNKNFATSVAFSNSIKIEIFYKVK